MVASGLAMSRPAISGATVDRLVHRLAATGGIRRAEGGGRQHAERAGEHGGAVRQNIAEEIIGHDHVELLRRAHQLHGAIVGVHVFERHVGVIQIVQPLLHFFAPQHTPHDSITVAFSTECRRL